MAFDNSRHHINAGGTPYIGTSLDKFWTYDRNISSSGELRTNAHDNSKM